MDDHTSWFRFTTGVPLNNLFLKVDDDHTLWFWFKTGVPAAKTKTKHDNKNGCNHNLVNITHKLVLNHHTELLARLIHCLLSKAKLT